MALNYCEYLEENINIVYNYTWKKQRLRSKNQKQLILLWLSFKNYTISHKEVKQKLLARFKSCTLNDGLSFGKEGESYFRLNVATS